MIKKYILISILVFIVTFKLFGIDVDYNNYIHILSNNKIPLINLEPIFILFKLLYKSTSNIIILITFFYFFYSSISIFITVNLIYKFSNQILISFLIYFSNYYFLHDYVQVRVAVSSSLFLLSIIYIDKNKTNYFLINSVGMLFHYSSIVSILVFIILKYLKRINFYFLFLTLSFCITFLNYNYFDMLLHIPFVNLKLYKFISFINTRSTYNIINLFNFNITTHLFFMMIFFSFYKEVFQINSFYDNLFKIYIISICFYLIFSKIPVLAFRLYEYLAIVEILLIPEFLKVFKQKYFGVTLLFILFFLRIYNMFYLNKIIYT